MNNELLENICHQTPHFFQLLVFNPFRVSVPIYSKVFQEKGYLIVLLFYISDVASAVPQKKFVPVFKSKIKGKLQSKNTKKSIHQSNEPFPKLSSTDNLVPSQPNSKCINNCIKPTFMIRKNLKQTGSSVAVNPLKRKPTPKKGGLENNFSIKQPSAAKKVKTLNALPPNVFAGKSSELTSVLPSSNKFVNEKGLTKNDKMTRVVKVKTLKIQSPQIQNNKPAIDMDRAVLPLVVSSTTDKVGIPKSQSAIRRENSPVIIKVGTPQKYSEGVSLAMEILSQASKSSQHVEIFSPKTDLMPTQYQVKMVLCFCCKSYVCSADFGDLDILHLKLRLI